ncbi:MAG: DUF1294 domain-containing protein [Clostridia bacterium]|nr:DUF1294 domain-containing protein [Clostridia bacterium]
MIVYFSVFVAVMSLVAFILYAADKKKAKKGAWRIPEATLLGVGFCGGAVGALLAMNMLRHKTKHWYFWVVNIVGLVLHIVIAAWMILYL